MWASYSVFVTGSVEIYAENGLIETMQVYLLAVAWGIYLATGTWEAVGQVNPAVLLAAFIALRSSFEYAKDEVMQVLSSLFSACREGGNYSPLAVRNLRAT